MNYNDFDIVLHNQFEACRKLLASKAKEYAPSEDDRLSAFKTAACIQGRTPIQALVGQMSKHTISLFEMAENDVDDLDLWHEKISDSINYLFLLKGLLIDRFTNEAQI